MKGNATRKANTDDSDPTWPRKVQPGRSEVTVYRRKTPRGNFSFMVANYADGERRRFDCYPTAAKALDAADKLARRLDRRDYVAASITQSQAVEYADSAEALKPFGVSVRNATATVAQCLKIVGDLPNLHAAAKLYGLRHKQTVKKPVPEVVAEFLKLRADRGASKRYLSDLRARLERFAKDCTKHACDVTTADIQDWLDGESLKPRNYQHFRTVLFTLFRHAVARGCAADNPVAGVERVKVNGGEVEIFTPVEMSRLLETARATRPDFLPCLAIGAFAGLRSAEVERLEWSDIHLADNFIVVGADKAKTASRRIVPIHDNLAYWLRPYLQRRGQVWPGTHDDFYIAQQEIAAATAVDADEERGVNAVEAVKWKANGLRHSYASYRFAQTGDAGRVAGELGNSASVVHKHYRELVTAKEADRWFALKPAAEASNVLPLVKA